MKLLRTRPLHTLALCLLAGTAAIPLPFGVTPSFAQGTARSVALTIPAQPVPRALANLSARTGLQVLYAGNKAYDIMSRPVSGTYPPDEALRIMLAETGIQWRFIGDNAVTISVPGEATAPAPSVAADGSLVLDTIEVSSYGAANLPFETPGSTNYISGQELERFLGLTSGSIFQGTPGVISGSSNNGAAIDPNIRGLQGMNRVATTIDGSQQSTSTYRGYAGVDNRTYVDPDLISGITITKGPDGPVGGAIGGTIAMETLGVDDILKPGETYGVRARVGLNSNGVTPIEGATDPRPGTSDTDNGNVSIAAAVTTPGVDVVAAFVRRKSGNYFAGTQGDLTVEDLDGSQKRLSSYGYGQQVFNTSEDVTSGLLKATLRPAEGHELKLGYLHYGSVFGEVTPGIVNSGNYTVQIPLSSASVDQITAQYHFKPENNDLIDFRMNAYASNVDEDGYYTLYTDSYLVPQTSFNTGVEASNTSRFEIASTPLTLRYGGSYRYEHSDSDGALYKTGGPSVTTWVQPAVGQLAVTTLFGRAKWEPLSWLTLEGGVEYLNYDSAFNGTEIYTYSGPAFTGYSGSGVSPSASVTVTPLPGWQLYAQYQSGIRPPSVRETSMVRYEQVFNPDLEAEQASNWEVGTNLLKNDLFLPGDKARLKLAYFDNTTYDYIGRSYDIYSNAMEFFNYDRVVFKGFELSGGYDAGWAFVDFGFNYYTHFESCLKNGKCIDYTLQADYLANQVPPKFTASVTAGLRFWEDRVTVGGRFTYMGQRLAAVVEDPSYFWITKLWAPYTVIDLFGQWKINDTLTLDVGAQNLLDAYYVDALNNTDMPAPGRVIRGSLTAKLGGSDPLPWLPFGRPASARNMPWTGPYLGAHLGTGVGHINGSTAALNGTANAIAAYESADQSLTNILGGVQAGFNYQFANGIVVGLESDFSWTRMTDGRDVLATESQTLFERNMLEARIDYSFEWLSTIRARAGYANDRLFVYGTVGVAFLRELEERTQYRSTTASSSVPAGRLTEPFFIENAEATRTGFAVGGGAEFALADNWSLKAEYLYAAFGAKDFQFKNARAGVTRPYSVRTICRANNSTPPCPGGVTTIINQTYPGSSETINGRNAPNSADLQLLKVGVNYRF